MKKLMLILSITVITSCKKYEPCGICNESIELYNLDSPIYNKKDYTKEELIEKIKNEGTLFRDSEIKTKRCGEDFKFYDGLIYVSCNTTQGTISIHKCKNNRLSRKKDEYR